MTETEKKSRTEIKMEALALQKLGEQLLDLSSDQLLQIQIPSEIKDAVKFAKTTKKHGARRRQMQYIGALMRKFNPEPIEKAINEIKLDKYRHSKKTNQIQQWHKDLISGNKSLIEELIQSYPGVERQKINQLVRNAKKAALKNTPSKSSQTLLKYLRQIQDS